MDKIGLRECGRRLGVSDTAVRKAIAAGRITVEGHTKSGRPLVGWPLAHQQWLANTDEGRRTHIGAGAKVTASHKPPPVMKPRKAPPKISGSKPDTTPPVEPARAPAVLPPADAQTPEPEAPEQPDTPAVAAGPNYQQSRAIREAYQARLAKLDYEERVGKLASIDTFKAAQYRLVTAAKTRLLGISAECKSRVPDLPLSVIAAIDGVVREALEDLANERA